MFEIYVIQGPRESGKTSTVLCMLYEHVVCRESCLVVLRDHRELQFFADEWSRLFPHVPRPDYVIISNTLKVRGRHYEHVYIENVDLYEDVWHDDRIQTIMPCITKSITLTASPYDLPTFHDYVAPPEPSAPLTVKAGILNRWRRRSATVE